MERSRNGQHGTSICRRLQGGRDESQKKACAEQIYTHFIKMGPAENYQLDLGHSCTCAYVVMLELAYSAGGFIVHFLRGT
eukprot:468816-Pelagomonas_calceolata.AAC.2